MKKRFKGKKMWTSMFLSYALMILLFFLAFSGVVIYETYTMGLERVEKEHDLDTQDVVALFEKRAITAQSVANNINSSITIKKLYMSVLNGDTALDSYTLYSILKALQQIQASANRLDMEEVSIFVNSYSRAYSYSGVIDLQEPFTGWPYVKPRFWVGTLQDVLGVNANNKLSFSRQALVYIDRYTYLTGANVSSSRGCVAVTFNIDALRADIEEAIGSDAGYQLSMADEVLLSGGDVSGEAVLAKSEAMPDVTIELFFHEPLIPRDTLATVTRLLIGCLFLTVAFLALAYYFSRTYYKPIEHIGRLVIDAPTPQSTDEMTNIISGIRDLIGERNGYREKMLTIAPYAQQGMLHGVLSGNIQNDSVQVLSSKSYLDLQKPFFIIAAVNVAWPKNSSGDAALHNHVIRETCDKLCSIFSTEECRFFTYRRDDNNLFLIANSDSGNEMDDVFFQIHKFFTENMEEPDCLVTMGIDGVQEDISELHAACMRALQALDNMIACGRGEVYFYEDEDRGGHTSYYFPKNSEVRLGKMIRERDLKGIQAFLDDIYKRNVSRTSLKPAALHALVDELHITTMKCIKDATELGTTHISVEKMSNVATLEETFHYYGAVYEALITSLQDVDASMPEHSTLSATILYFIETNYCMPEMSLQYLTDNFGVSSKYISLLCKKELGTTYLQYINGKRIQHAMELLQSGDYSMEQVGEMCGYTNSLTFRRNFKAFTGITPSEYRTGTAESDDA